MKYLLALIFMLALTSQALAANFSMDFNEIGWTQEEKNFFKAAVVSLLHENSITDRPQQYNSNLLTLDFSGTTATKPAIEAALTDAAVNAKVTSLVSLTVLTRDEYSAQEVDGWDVTIQEFMQAYTQVLIQKLAAQGVSISMTKQEVVDQMKINRGL